MLQECLTFSEIGDYLRCSPDPSCKVNLLGLTEESIHNQNPHRKVRLDHYLLWTNFYLHVKIFCEVHESIIIAITVDHHCLWVQYSWFLWVSLAYEFTSSRKYIQALLSIYLRSRTCYQQNYVSTNQVIFVYSQTLTPNE